jgi:hypothetical protein
LQSVQRWCLSNPDIALPDFRLFFHVKNSLVGWTFDGLEKLFEAIIEFLDEIDSLELEVGFSH